MRDIKIIVMKETNDQTKGLMRDCFFVRQGEREGERCFYSEILYVEASGCYCYIHRRDKPRLSIAYPLLMSDPFFARGYVPAGTPELYREPLRSGWLYRGKRSVSARACLQSVHLTERRSSGVLISGI